MPQEKISKYTCTIDDTVYDVYMMNKKPELSWIIANKNGYEMVHDVNDNAGFDLLNKIVDHRTEELGISNGMDVLETTVQHEQSSYRPMKQIMHKTGIVVITTAAIILALYGFYATHKKK